MKKLLFVIALALLPVRSGASVKCTGVPCIDTTGITSPITTDPVSATGVWTFNNAANTPATMSDGVIDSTLTATRVTFAGASGRLSDDADMTFATDTLTATHANVKGGTGTGVLSVGGVICKGAPAATTTQATEQIVATCTIPANTVVAGGIIKIDFNVVTAANGNNKTFQIKTNGTGGATIYSSTAVAANNSSLQPYGDCSLRWETATTAAATCSGVRSTRGSYNGGGTITASGVNEGMAVTWANQNTIDFTLTTPTANGDATLQSYSVEVVQ